MIYVGRSNVSLSIWKNWRKRASRNNWCGAQDLNLHALRHTVLSRARLPIPPAPRLGFNLRLVECVEQGYSAQLGR